MLSLHDKILDHRPTPATGSLGVIPRPTVIVLIVLIADIKVSLVRWVINAKRIEPDILLLSRVRAI